MKTKCLIAAFLVQGLCLAATHSTHAEEEPAMKNIYFVAGKGSHGKDCHAFSAGSKLLASILNKNVTGVNAVVYENGWPDDPSFLDNAAAVVMFSDGLNHHVGKDHWEALDKMAKQGSGIAMLHYAVVVPKGKVGNHFLDWLGGYYEMGWSVNPHWEAKFESFTEHPVTRGMKPFTINDEWYFHMRFREAMQNVTPVLSAHPPASAMSRPDGPHSGNPAVRAALKNGELQHVAWVATNAAGGRGFGFTGAHFHKNWQEENFRRLVLNAIAWIAKVEIPPEGIPVTIPE